jgi:GT2 family glycosyltransferase
MKQHLLQCGEHIADVSKHHDLDGCLALRWALPRHWSCSVIIPTRDRADLLEQCLSSLWESTSRARESGLELEVLVVDNGSVEDETFALFRHWQHRLPEHFQVLRCDEPFNWSRLNNLAAAEARGELLLLLNNDIEAHQEGWIEAMAAQALRPAVGAVGAVLLYPNRAIQHAGVVVGFHGGADHAYRGLPLDHHVHRGRSRLLSRWGAVTGACLMVRAAVLEQIGGLDEGLPVEFNDIDLCLRLDRLGFHNVIPPDAVLIHHESQSRDARRSATAEAALLRMQRRWSVRLRQASPWWPIQSEKNCCDGRPVGLSNLVLPKEG